MRRIPSTMATQHPDNALAPYWDKKADPFISAYQEIEEAIHCYQDLGVSEYMWDWEGKHADAAVIDRMFSKYGDYFVKNQLGRDKFLTIRIPNIWQEKGYNLLQAMTVILSSEDFARDLKFADRPLFEVILPMTERPEQLMRIHTLFEKLAQFKNTDFTKKEPDNKDYLELIPLVEGFSSQLGIAELLSNYVALHQEHFGFKPSYIRPFLAGSDSALSAGFLAGILGNKLALSRIYEFSEQTGIAVFPFIGTGSLPFRGGLSPVNIDRFLMEFPGVRTATVQSSFRYDHPKEMVKAAIARLESELPKTKPKIINRDDQNKLVKIAKLGEENYIKTLGGLLEVMRPIFKAMPKRRDRRQHIGLLAYGRDMAGEKLPRAITFTGGFYSLGVPPEFIGLGRTLKSLSDHELEQLKSHYPSLVEDIKSAGRYLSRENLKTLASKSPAWQEVQRDVDLTEQILGVKFGPESADESEHLELSRQVMESLDNPVKLTELIDQTAQLRKSIG